MNQYTKRSLIHALLSLAVILLGILIFYVVANSLTEPPTPSTSDEPGAEFGKLLTALAAGIAILVVGIVDTVFSSFFVYLFAYFSHKNASAAIEEGGEKLAFPKALKILSLIEMIFSVIIGIVALLLMTGGLTMMAL